MQNPDPHRDGGSSSHEWKVWRKCQAQMEGLETVKTMFKFCIFISLSGLRRDSTWTQLSEQFKKYVDGFSTQGLSYWLGDSRRIWRIKEHYTVCVIKTLQLFTCVITQNSKVKVKPKSRPGVLSNAAFIATNTHEKTKSPVHIPSPLQVTSNNCTSMLLLILRLIPKPFI